MWSYRVYRAYGPYRTSSRSTRSFRLQYTYIPTTTSQLAAAYFQKLLSFQLSCKLTTTYSSSVLFSIGTTAEVVFVLLHIVIRASRIEREEEGERDEKKRDKQGQCGSLRVCYPIQPIRCCFHISTFVFTATTISHQLVCAALQKLLAYLLLSPLTNESLLAFRFPFLFALQGRRSLIISFEVSEAVMQFLKKDRKQFLL